VTESKPILFSTILGLVAAIALIMGLNALSQTAEQPVLEKAAPSSSLFGQTGGADSRSQISEVKVAATAVNPWQFFPILITAFFVALTGYAYARVRLG
jgi:hypothetical protein